MHSLWSNMRLFCTCLSLAFCTAASSSQRTSANSSTSPVAYVYVSSTPANSITNVIAAFSASKTGQLTNITGSPYPYNDFSLSVNGDKLFGLGPSTYIDGYAIGTGGELTYLTSTDSSSYDPNGCGSPGWLFSDNTGADLYTEVFDYDCSNNGFQSYKVNNNGELTFLGSTNGGAGSFNGVYLPLSFIGNNQFGYEATNNGCFYYAIHQVQRTGSGDLNDEGASLPMPPPPPGYNIYIPLFSAADPAGRYVAVTMEPAVPPGCSSGVSIQVGSFTADSNGNLSSSNTYQDMPDTAITAVNDMKISPSGKLLAVAGSGGLQVFHFNGANPPSTYTPLLTADTINQMFWDHANHLYAISQSAGTLHVFTITATGYSEAAGSPYSITSPSYIAVKPR